MPQNDMALPGPVRHDPTFRPKNEPQKLQFYYTVQAIDEKMMIYLIYTKTA